MNRTLVLLVVAILAVLAVAGLLLLLLANHLHARAGAEEWPGGLGPLTSVPARFPATTTNAAAERFSELVGDLSDSPGDYVVRESKRADRTIELDEDVAALVEEHASTLDPLLEHLLTGGEMTWDHDPEKGFNNNPPPLFDHQNAAYYFIARALLRAHDGDAGAWHELHAAWLLAANLHERPEPLAQRFALTITRLVTATAWKLPLPVPAWFEEVRRQDPEQLLARAVQYQAWLTWEHAPRWVVREGAWVLWPAAKLFAAYYGNRQREMLAPLLGVPDCAFDADDFVDRRIAQAPRWNVVARAAFMRLVSWNDAYRYRAEREATVNALRIAAGEPVIAASRCEGVTWSVEALPGGDTRLKFSGKVGDPGEETRIPLVRTINKPA